MLNKILHTWTRAKAARDQVIAEQEQKSLIKQEGEFREYLTQCLNNVRYIKATINTLRSRANFAKGDTAGETRKIRANIRKKIEWYEGKLEEEQGMVEYYSSLVK